MEFIINTDLEKNLPSVIDFNFEELHGELSERLGHYNALVVTEDTIKEGKEERAKLNKLKAAVEDRRKEVKKLCLAPYEDFERKCKALTGMIDEAAGSIDAQVKSFEDAEKEEKRAALIAVYEVSIGEKRELLPFERFFSSKWLNKTVTLAAASGELRTAIQKAVSDIKVIQAMRLECEAQVLDVYFSTLDMSAALAEKNRFEARQEQLAKIREAETAPPEIKVVPGHGELTEGEAATAKRAIDAAFEDVPPEETKDVALVFYATTAAFRADMKAVAAKHNIKYGGIQ